MTLGDLSYRKSTRAATLCVPVVWRVVVRYLRFACMEEKRWSWQRDLHARLGVRSSYKMYQDFLGQKTSSILRWSTRKKLVTFHLDIITKLPLCRFVLVARVPNLHLSKLIREVSGHDRVSMIHKLCHNKSKWSQIERNISAHYLITAWTPYRRQIKIRMINWFK